MNKTEAYEYLTRDGNLAVPSSRYGRDSEECAPIAIAVATIIAANGADELTENLLDETMGYVVNDSDDVETIINEHGTIEDKRLLEDNLLQPEFDELDKLRDEFHQYKIELCDELRKFAVLAKTAETQIQEGRFHDGIATLEEGTSPMDTSRKLDAELYDSKTDSLWEFLVEIAVKLSEWPEEAR